MDFFITLINRKWVNYARELNEIFPQRQIKIYSSSNLNPLNFQSFIFCLLLVNRCEFSIKEKKVKINWHRDMIRMVSNKLSKLKKILRELGKFIHANLKRKHQRAQFTELYSITAQYKKNSIVNLYWFIPEDYQKCKFHVPLRILIEM